VESIPADWRDKLTAWGLLDPAATAGAVSLDQHVRDFQASPEAKHRSAKRAPGLARPVRTLAEAAKNERPSGHTPAPLGAGRAGSNSDRRHRAVDGVRAGFGDRTSEP